MNDAPIMAGFVAHKGIATIVIVAFSVCASPSANAQTIDHRSRIGPFLGDCVNRSLLLHDTNHSGHREVTFTLSFRSNGTIFGEPRRSFSFPEALGHEQQRFIADIARSIVSCAPLPFSKELGSAMAGRLYHFRYRLKPKQELRA